MNTWHRISLQRTALIVVMTTALWMFAQVAQALTLSDGTFNPTNWSGQMFVTGTSTGSAATGLSGGVPDDHRIISSLSSGSPLSGWDRSLFVDLNLTSVVNLATLGGITQIDYSEDHRCACIGGGMLWGPALEQGGKFYIVSGNAMPNSFTLPWQNEILSGLTAIDFEEVAVTSTTWSNPASHPDFSAAGSPITFGYVRAKAFIGSTQSFLDNWAVFVNETAVTSKNTSWGSLKSSYR